MSCDAVVRNPGITGVVDFIVKRLQKNSASRLSGNIQQQQCCCSSVVSNFDSLSLSARSVPPFHAGVEVTGEGTGDNNPTGRPHVAFRNILQDRSWYRWSRVDAFLKAAASL